ncbi:hypothetical protein B9479_003825 [Cryptococcus floricola]|uniref:Asl1-like glycosyl hydrolase catalytic domain-containing protein n=1 Tax=Cryptococcus floricola TaxID=2591691 RepID=A0A5D3AYU6_9TREE|nr:hypothetical protein B9479_003825 [Cryptococcus floricola]
MQLTALIPVLALLATPALARSSLHPHAAAHRRSVGQHERIAGAVEQRRDELAAANPRALAEKPKVQKRRKVVRRGTTCRVKDSSASATVSETASATSAAAETYAASAVSDVESSSDAAVSTDSAVESATEWATSVESSAAAETVSSTEAAVETASTTAAASSSVAAVAAYEVSSDSSSSVAASSTSSASTSTSTSAYTPNNIKAGIAGGDAYSMIGDHIGWWYDWNAVPSGHTGSAAIGVNMLWGAGTVDDTDASRLSAFQAITDTPAYIIGFEEPDCSTDGSANIAVADAVTVWENNIAQWKDKGSLLLSPSMCHQAAEQYIGWLSSFESQISTDFDILNLHINKNSMDGVKADIDYYYNNFGQKPIWVTEFACVDDSSDFTPCTDQSEINTFIQDIVDLFQADDRIYAYAYSTGEGLSDEWALVSNGVLTESGQTYTTALAKYH